MPLQVFTLEQSFNRILMHKQAFAQVFYDRLFEQFPQVKPLFMNTNMKLQQNKLLGALALVVSNLRHPEKLAEPLMEVHYANSDTSSPHDSSVGGPGKRNYPLWTGLWPTL